MRISPRHRLDTRAYVLLILGLTLGGVGSPLLSQTCQGLQSFRASSPKIGMVASFHDRGHTLAGSLATAAGPAFMAVTLGMGRASPSDSSFLVQSSTLGFEIPVNARGVEM